MILASKVIIALVGVPDSWANDGVYSRRAAIAQHEKMKLWTDGVVFWGKIERAKASWVDPTKEDMCRLVTIIQERHGLLDDGNLWASLKPITDGLKFKLRRKGRTVSGAGLLWDDAPRYCKQSPDQIKVPMARPCKTTIIVERFDL